MAGHMVYTTIVNAVRDGVLQEPFTISDLMYSCKNLKKGTCNTFPNKHRKGNPGGNSELFERISQGKFKLLRPFRYGL